MNILTVRYLSCVLFSAFSCLCIRASGLLTCCNVLFHTILLYTEWVWIYRIFIYFWILFSSLSFALQTSCEGLSSYLSSTLNPYITNVTVAAQLCSNFLCRGNGRCVRKNYNSNHYLHLNPENFRVMHVQSRYLVLGRPSFTDLKALSRGFTCQCYKGLSCSPRTYRELAKALKFSVKQGLHQKAQTLNKAVLDDTQQASITKDNIKKNLKV